MAFSVMDGEEKIGVVLGMSETDAVSAAQALKQKLYALITPQGLKTPQPKEGYLMKQNSENSFVPGDWQRRSVSSSHLFPTVATALSAASGGTLC